MSQPVLSQWRRSGSWYAASLPSGKHASIALSGNRAQVVIHAPGGEYLLFTEQPSVALAQAFVLGYATADAALSPATTLPTSDYRDAELARQAAIDAGQLALDEYDRQPDDREASACR